LVYIAIKLLGFIVLLNGSSPVQCVVLCTAYLPYNLRTTLQSIALSQIAQRVTKSLFLTVHFRKIRKVQHGFHIT